MSEPATIETVNKAIDEYKSPSVTLGMIVLWYQNAKKNQDGLPAIVCRIIPNSRYIELWLPTQNSRKRRVRHVDDPEVIRQKNMTEKEGGWDHTEQNKALQALVAFRRPKPDPEPKS
jgi:hypothetical protein